MQATSWFLVEHEVAARLRVSRQTLQRWRRETRAGASVGPRAITLGPRRIAYALNDIEAWEAAARAEPSRSA